MVALVASGASVAQARSQSPCEKAHLDKSCHHIKAVGHRFREYSSSKTNEDTLKALKYIRAHGVRNFETDVWMSVDGHDFVWHDATWARVASPASLKKAGLDPHSPVSQATWAQIKLVRTKGGQPVPSLRTIEKYAVQHHMLGKFELKWGLNDPAAEYKYVKSIGNPHYVTFYQVPHAETCAVDAVAAAHQAGFRVGLAQDVSCKMTDAFFAAHYRYVELALSSITPAHVKHLHKLGVIVGNRDSATKSSWNKLVHAKVDFIIAPSPTALRKWLG
jgi:glycerophosphoryl diester phosphodiesterase